MISERYAKMYCCEDISKIENYDKAIADEVCMWECHHKAEILPCGVFSQDDLKKHKLFNKQPAEYLVFLTKPAHKALHNKAKPPMRNSDSIAKFIKARGKPVVQLSKGTLDFVAEYSSTNNACMNTRIWRVSIANCCKGKAKSAGGFVWMYKEDYEKTNKGN